MNKLSIKEFIDYIKTQESYQKILETYNPYMAFLGGSRGLNTNRENSDYDIIMIAGNHNIDLSNKVSFMNENISNDKNLPVHALIWSLDKYLDFLSYTLNSRLPTPHIMMACIMGFNNGTELELHTKKDMDDNVLNALNFLNINRKKIIEISLYNLINELKFDLKVLTNGGKITYNHKIYYHLLTGYDLMNKTDSSKLIKKLREEITLSDTDIEDFNFKIKYLNNFMLNYRESDYDTFRAQLEVILWQLKQ